MIEGRQASSDGEWQGVLDDTPVKGGEQTRWKNENQGKQADPLVPAEDTGLRR